MNLPYIPDYEMQLCFFLFLCGAAPIMFCAPEILEIWLKQVPEYSVLFLRLSFVYILLQTWSQTLYTLMLASGDIKLYQIVVGGASLLSFDISSAASSIARDK